MADFECQGYIKHYPSRDGVVFYLQKIVTEKSEDKGEYTQMTDNYALFFEILRKFKDRKIRITVEKVEE